jgi:hypothetical protein
MKRFTGGSRFSRTWLGWAAENYVDEKKLVTPAARHQTKKRGIGLNDAPNFLRNMAEGVGFEPTVEFPPLRFSSPHRPFSPNAKTYELPGNQTTRSRQSTAHPGNPITSSRQLRAKFEERHRNRRVAI